MNIYSLQQEWIGLLFKKKKKNNTVSFLRLTQPTFIESLQTSMSYCFLDFEQFNTDNLLAWLRDNFDEHLYDAIREPVINLDYDGVGIYECFLEFDSVSDSIQAIMEGFRLTKEDAEDFYSKVLSYRNLKTWIIMSIRNQKFFLRNFSNTIRKDKDLFEKSKIEFISKTKTTNAILQESKKEISSIKETFSNLNFNNLRLSLKRNPKIQKLIKKVTSKRRKNKKTEIEPAIGMAKSKNHSTQLLQNQTSKFKIFICNLSFSFVFVYTLGTFSSIIPKNFSSIQFGKRSLLQCRIPKMKEDDREDDFLYFSFCSFLFIFRVSLFKHTTVFVFSKFLFSLKLLPFVYQFRNYNNKTDFFCLNNHRFSSYFHRFFQPYSVLIFVWDPQRFGNLGLCFPFPSFLRVVFQ